LLADARRQLERGRTAEAVRLLNRAAGVAPADHRVQHWLAEAHRRSGQAEAAERHYRRAAELAPATETLLNHGNALLELRRPDEALASYQSALALGAGVPAAHYGLGCALVALKQPAAAAFAQALALAPDFVPAHEALVEVYRAAGNAAAACQAACHALRTVDTPALRAGFVGTVVDAVPDATTPGLARLMQRALEERWRRPQDLARAAAVIAARQPIDPTAGLLRSLLEAAPLCHAELERALTDRRRGLLASTLEASLPPASLAAAGVLARQGWITEFAWFCTPEESAQVDRLQQSVQSALDRGEVPAAMAVVLGMYRPLSALAGAERLLAARVPAAQASVFAQQIGEPAEEARLRARIPRATAIEGDVSNAVRDQYEANPYPRWLALPAAAPRLPYATWLHRRFPALPAPDERTLELLVAGCGSGQHPLELLHSFSHIAVLGIDLSLTSLAYAARMAASLGIEGLDLRQADLLRLDELGRSFDVIESSGVLHHLADLWAGWRALIGLLRPGGVMHISLYTKRGRAEVRQARDWIAAQGFEPTAEGIRACRRAMLRLPDAWAERLAANADFASLSGCRDLLFHVHESAVTLPEIADFLAAAGLECLGLDSPPAIARAFAASGGSANDLLAWDRFEADNPRCFASMVHLWVRKP
jgi:SAM-dependent methyltransferase